LRYEAIIPRKVTAKDYKINEQSRRVFKVKDRIKYQKGIGRDDEILRLSRPSSLANQSQGFFDTYLTDEPLKLVGPESNQRVCVRVNVAKDVELSAVYLKPQGEISDRGERGFEFIVLGKQNDWTHCEVVGDFRGELEVSIQALNKDFKSTAEVRSSLKISD
jgi:hypothetical protein